MKKAWQRFVDWLFAWQNYDEIVRLRKKKKSRRK